VRTELAAPDVAGRAGMRRTMFLCQDGVVLCTTLRALDEVGILDRALPDGGSLAELHPDLTEAGFGALRIGLRTLAGVGWIGDELTLDPETTLLRWTEAGRQVVGHRERYVAAGRFLAGFSGAEDDAWSRPWESAQVVSFLGLVEQARDRWRLGDELPDDLAALVTAHLDAALIVPAMLSLHETDRLDERGPELPDGELGEGMGGLLAALGWVGAPGEGWTTTGQQGRAFALSFGGVATYLPLLSRLPEMYRGELVVEPGDGGEWHVHRRINLAISTKAHARYFADADPVFIDLFDRPAEARPGFIADMGCGDGAWLAHLHELLRERLGEVPPMVGIDASSTALERAREKLDGAGVEALLLRGDVTDPDRLASELAERGLRMEDGLHIRAFLDHERAYGGADPEIAAPGWSSGAYIDAEGRPIEAEALERDLIAHLGRWARHAPKHGMVVLEAHCVAPRIASRNLGALHSVAFDAHQAYSRQYPIEHAAFVRCAQEAGLRPEGRHERRYPSNRSFVTISLNRCLVPGRAEEALPAIDPGAPREDTWRPDPGVEREDGRALHAMLFEGGDVRFPRLWCCAPTGFVVAGALEAVERRLADAREGDAIRVLDYGAGTGTATIELLKACRERGVDRRLEEAGVALELHLVDRPSSWYAQGYDVLGHQAWTRFHSLSAADGSFRPLLEVTGGREMDAVMTNMVLHLIPPKALDRAAEQLGSVLGPGGRLLWSSPDLGPPGPHAVLLHDPNRALRERWLELLHRGDGAGPSSRVREAVQMAREGLDTGAMRAAQERAERRILPHPVASDVTAALEGHFDGEVELRSYEMLSEEIVDGLLVPSNQAEYLPEIADRPTREEVIRELMRGEVIPVMQEGPAGTALGLNLHWTLGAFARR
jgi:SAM-dependent methyltransferase